MQITNKKYGRINALYNRLKKSSSGVSIKELADEFEVSTKTIQRYLYEELALLGAVKIGRNWKIDENMAQDSLKNHQRLVLKILDNMAKNVGELFYLQAHSLIQGISTQLDSAIWTHLNSEYLDDSTLQIFELLESYIKKRNEIHFRYGDKQFHIQPLKILLFDGFWYLVGIDCNDNHTLKKFYLKDIGDIVATNGYFTLSLDIETKLKNANSIWFGLNEPFAIRLFVESKMAKYFLRKPLPTQIFFGKHNDGSIEIEVKITNEMEILPLIYRYIPFVKVIEPQWLADKVKSEIKGYLKSL